MEGETTALAKWAQKKGYGKQLLDWIKGNPGKTAAGIGTAVAGLGLAHHEGEEDEEHRR
jgi:hypothetical protein